MSNATADQLVSKMSQHLESVHPGQDAEFTEACVPGDAIWQGDLCLKIMETVPGGMILLENPSEEDRQLVPEGGEGSRHKLASLEGVELYRPADWPNEESLVGPCFKLSKANTVTHPRHGDVKIPSGFTVGCFYQREFDAEQKRERRARD